MEEGLGANIILSYLLRNIYLDYDQLYIKEIFTRWYVGVNAASF